MHARTLSTLGTTLLTLAVAAGGAGYTTGQHDLARLALLVSVPAATMLVIGVLRHHTTLNGDQLAAAHRAGYVLALDHVARGLLAAPTAPTGGSHDDTPRADNVHHLYTPHERRAG
ncbi:hypothetical protein [Streptomyces sp. enrichment culture]|uniref:hypothetical protein n=1 Tax=Streptomyces sp. enrichment culture TaxID=1795815 RepID=UPI003F547F6E